MSVDVMWIPFDCTQCLPIETLHTVNPQKRHHPSNKTRILIRPPVNLKNNKQKLPNSNKSHIWTLRERIRDLRIFGKYEMWALWGEKKHALYKAFSNNWSRLSNEMLCILPARGGTKRPEVKGRGWQKHFKNSLWPFESLQLFEL